MRYDLGNGDIDNDPIEDNDGLSTSFYQHAYNNTFTPEEKQWRKIIKKSARLHKRLNTMEDPEEAYYKFSKLNNETRELLVAFHGEDNGYNQTPENLLGKLRLGAGWFITSPFKGIFSAVEDYSKKLGGVALMAQTLTNGTQPKSFDEAVNTVYRAFNDQESFYDNDMDARLTEKHGKVKAFIAKQTLEGKTPGEIIKLWGKLDPEFIDAMSSFMSEYNKWNNNILEDFRQAKLSPGRTFANFILGERGEDTGVLGDITKSVGKTLGMSDKEIKKSLKGIDRDKLFSAYSGTTDATAFILMDPLTYVTGGGSAGFRLMGKAISTRSIIMDIAKSGNIKKLFEQPEVIKFWDGYGAKIKELSIARENKNSELAANIMNDIKTNVRRFNIDEDIEMALKNGLFDSKSAYAFFDEAQNLSYLMAGRVAQTSYHKVGVPVAADLRQKTISFRKAWNSFATSNKTFKNINVATDELVDELVTVGREKGGSAATPVLDKAYDDLQKFRNAFVKYVSYHPGDEAIEMGADAAKTISKFKNIARMIAPRDLADALGERFLVATTAERFQIMAGMYRSIALKLGIDKLPGGMDQIDALVNAKFGEIGMTRGVADDPLSWGTDLGRYVDEVEGSLFDFQGTDIIGNFDWISLQKLAADAALYTFGKAGSGKSHVGRLLGGAANNRFSDMVVRSWSFFALAPKLGIRSTIDEQFLFAMVAPPYVSKLYFSGIAKSGGKAITRYTADKRTTGVIGNLLRKTIVKPLGLKGLDPANELSKSFRQDLLASASDYATANNLPIEAVMPIFEEFLATEAVSLSKLLKGKPDLASDMVGLIRFYPNMLDSAFAGMAKDIGGKVVEKTKNVNIVDETQLTKAHDAFDLATVNNFYLIKPRDISSEHLKLVMYDAFYMTFYNAKVAGLDLTEQFIKYDGLKTSSDAKLFIDDFVGYLTNPEYPSRWAKFATQRRGVELLERKGMSNAQIAEAYARKIARDMYKTFHGDESYYKQDLVDFFKKNPDPSLNMATVKEIMSKLSFDEYSTLIGDKLRKTEIATSLDPRTLKRPSGKGFLEGKNLVKNGYNWIFDSYDRTVTSMHRQPAVVAYYLYYRDMFRVNENMYKSKMIDNMIETMSAEQLQNIDIGKIAADRTEKVFVEQAMNNAVHSVLKFADNPHIRTNVVSSMRNVNRFFRAAEDFWRRIYRLKDVAPRVVWRLRLMNHGLNGVGTAHEDQQGNKYFVIPTDNVLFAAINPVFETLTGEGFISPLSGEAFTFNFASTNPSFQDQAGIPFISGPVGGLSVLGLQAIARSWGGDAGNKFAEDLDTLAMGDMGDNLELKSLLPPILTRTWNMFDADEKAEHNHSAILSSIASHQAAGLGLSPTATRKEKQEYLDSLRTGAHNFIFMRSLLSTILPFSLNSKENTTLPDYVQDTGIPDIRSEYYDVLFAVLEKYGDDVSDPFEVANTIFAGKHPGKLVYTISRSAKATKAIVAQTKQTKDWILNNRGFVDTYQGSGAAYFFAPQVGDAYPGMYKWLQKSGLTDTIPDTEYLDAMLVLEDKQRYFDISDWEREELSKVADYESRSRIIYEAARKREALKNSNPLLEDALTPDGGFSVTEELKIFKDIKEILNDKNAPITKAQRKSAKEAIDIFERGYNYITNPIVSQVSDASQLKLGTRNSVMDELQGIAAGDPFLRQLNAKIFFPVLKFYSRNTFTSNAIGQ
jgi:hypothetical protein